MTEIKFPVITCANCCSSCVYTNQRTKPKIETHAAHYTVAKTERWCTLHNMPTVREGLCDDYKREEKRGAVMAIKRALKQVERLKLILAIAANFDKISDGMFVDHNTWYFVENGYLVYSYCSKNQYTHKVSCKSSTKDDILKILFEMTK